MIAKLLYNPFERIAGWKALAIGLAAMALTAMGGQMNNVIFDGAIDIHAPVVHSRAEAFMAQGVAWLSLWVCFCLMGWMFVGKRFRVIDIAGTMALSRFPLLFLASAAALPIVPAGLWDIPKLIYFGIVSIACGIWMVVLMYNGFTVSCNLKGHKAAIPFIGGLISAEVVSQLLLYFLFGLYSPQAKADGPFVIPEGQTIEQTAAIVIDCFQKGEFKQAALYFDDTMKKQFTPLQARVFWGQIEMKLGQFLGQQPAVEAGEMEGYRLLHVPCEFSKEKIKLQLAFDAKGYIAGLYALPGE